MDEERFSKGVRRVSRIEEICLLEKLVNSPFSAASNEDSSANVYGARDIAEPSVITDSLILKACDWAAGYKASACFQL